LSYDYQNYIGTSYFHLEVRGGLGDRIRNVLSHIAIHIPNYTALYPIFISARCLSVKSHFVFGKCIIKVYCILICGRFCENGRDL
jgi:hypothetical protein